MPFSFLKKFRPLPYLRISLEKLESTSTVSSNFEGRETKFSFVSDHSFEGDLFLQLLVRIRGIYLTFKTTAEVKPKR